MSDAHMIDDEDHRLDRKFLDPGKVLDKADDVHPDHLNRATRRKIAKRYHVFKHDGLWKRLQKENNHEKSIRRPR